MFNVMDKLKVTFGTSRALWTWAMRYAAWLMNRYNPYKGLTSYEIVFGKPYDGQICEFSEPVWLLKVPHEGQCKVASYDFSGKSRMPGQFLALRWKLFGAYKVCREGEHRLEDVHASFECNSWRFVSK